MWLSTASLGPERHTTAALLCRVYSLPLPLRLQPYSQASIMQVAWVLTPSANNGVEAAQERGDTAAEDKGLGQDDSAGGVAASQASLALCQRGPGSGSPHCSPTRGRAVWREPGCALPLVLGAPGGTHPPPLAPGLLQEVEAHEFCSFLFVVIVVLDCETEFKENSVKLKCIPPTGQPDTRESRAPPTSPAFFSCFPLIPSPALLTSVHAPCSLWGVLPPSSSPLLLSWPRPPSAITFTFGYLLGARCCAILQTFNPYSPWRGALSLCPILQISKLRRSEVVIHRRLQANGY